MERDPLGYVWRTARLRNLLAVLLVLIAFPVGWLALDLIRIGIDDAMGGRAFASGGTAPFLRLALALPERIAEAPVVLFPGIPLSRDGFALATIVALLGVAALAALVVFALWSLWTGIGRQAVLTLRRRLVEALVEARGSARDDARHAAALAGDGLVSEGGFLGGALIAPALAAGSVTLAALYALAVDWRLAVAALAALVAFALVRSPRAEALARVAGARRGEGAALNRSLLDLVRRLPAVRAHGTAAAERRQIEAELARTGRPLRGAETAAARLGSLATLVSLAAGAAVFGAGLWLALADGVTPGEAVAATVALGLAVLGIDAILRWTQGLARVRPLFDEIARALGSLQARSRPASAGPLPGAGTLVAEGLAAYDPATGVRIAGIDLSIAFPAHVAVVGDVSAGARAFAALVGGQLDPSAGRLAFGGVDLAGVDPGERARRIAFAGGDTILMAGSLRENLLYGGPDPDSPETERRLIDAVSVVGLDRFVYARGLSGTIDPARHAGLASTIVDARRALRAALAAEGLDRFVDPFDPAVYNRHATIGENILFGVALGDTFREANLAGHPFVRAILEAEALTKPLAAMGLAIARSMVEIFADVPDGHPLFDRYAFFTAAERGYFEDLVARQAERRRGAESSRDRERLMGLAFRYSESRHRLGLLDEELERRLVAARAAFANLLPTSLKPAVEFYDPDRLCAAASLQDNLLFGRVTQERAGAAGETQRVVRRVLSERGLDGDVFRIGLDTRIDPRGEGLGPNEVAAIDLARCLVRQPDIVVVERAAEGLTGELADGLVERLRRALVGRGLVIVVPALSPRMDRPPFDRVLRFERGSLAAAADRRLERVKEPAA